MRGTRHLPAILLSALSLGCATSVDVVVDAGDDLASYHTWNWLPVARPRIEAPDGDSAALDAKLSRLIEEHLLANGFVRSASDADFFVSYQLALRNHSVVVNQPNAIYQLDSLHSDGSFVIESSRAVTRVYTELQLAVGISQGPGRTLWQAELSQYVEDSFSWKLSDAVAAVLGSFPRHQPRGDAEGEAPLRPVCGDAAAAPKPEGDRSDRDPSSASKQEAPAIRRCPEDAIDPGPARPLPRQRRPAQQTLA